ncbi:hypothetical protein [Mucilaginibacter pedocola]|uniref:MotA/TolQ/ExbB proton channel domain-containing protein n=1 Tax=Mucilaginibacter pedocola TaxID=1792845 RepID=A0A1S9PB03_9SPHI|nr:hypothetical protein [Mucilaginibacter pedocola]OOQ58135.1 hypothetical protein BC343_10820 [Mucilaginibacter pedocola]
MELVLLFAAPVIQLILSVLKLCRSISIPLAAIYMGAVFAGAICSFIGMKIMLSQMAVASHGQGFCGMPALGFLFGGAFITLISTSLIAGICAIIEVRNKRRNTRYQLNN